MSTESSPLLSYRLFRVAGEAEMPGPIQEEAPLVVGVGGLASGGAHPDPARQLSTFFGVVVPTVLSMFSIVVFMRIGFVVGQAGFLQSLLMLAVAYLIISLTVLSVCAISTNGAVQAGGAYFMISRTLGPEFGGSIGLMFFLANVCACGVYVLGLVEAILDVFGANGAEPPGAKALPQGYLYSFLYGSLVLLLCLVVCLVGAQIYSKAAFFIFLVVNVVLVTIFASFFAVSPHEVLVAREGNQSFNASFTGFNISTLRANMHGRPGPGDARCHPPHTPNRNLGLQTPGQVSKRLGSPRNPASFPKYRTCILNCSQVHCAPGFQLAEAPSPHSCTRRLREMGGGAPRSLSVPSPCSALQSCFPPCIWGAKGSMQLGRKLCTFFLAKNGGLEGEHAAVEGRECRWVWGLPCKKQDPCPLPPPPSASPAMYSRDYTTNTTMSFATVFAVMFNGCTGIMAGSNMSGELKNASRSIPRGTIIALLYTFSIYFLLFFMTGFTCERALLKGDYGFFRAINVWPPFVLIGIYAASLSASMSNLIGASRILHALAKDDLFGIVLAPAKRVSKGGNPWVAVLYTWALVQLVLLAGKLNTIAGIVTVFYLVAYAAVDLACLALEWASAPNFRPTFQVFSWHTCLLGILSCLVMMFLISPGGASGSLGLMLLLLGFIHLRSAASSWGYISQALIFHQVRKYLLLLDIRKDHVKFWRPQILLMVANPRGGSQLIKFINHLKKGGLFVLGHVEIGDLDTMPSDPIQAHYNFWLSLVDKLNVKAFVDLTLSPSVRQGTQHLLRITGLGGMKPNTLVLGFYDNCVPEDYFLQDPAFSQARENDEFGVDLTALQAHFPPVREGEIHRALSPAEYVAIISDAVKMHKNVCLARHFHLLEKDLPSSSSKKRFEGCYIDVWPLNLLRPDTPAYVDICSLFLLQMACILTMVSSWKSARLRIFLCVESGDVGWVSKEEKLKELLTKLRIKATIKIVTWDQVVALHGHQQVGGEGPPPEGAQLPPFPPGKEAREAFLHTATFPVTDEFLASVNSLLLRQEGQTAVRFLYLPRPPADTAQYQRYLEQLELLTTGLGPTLLIHGLTPVTCTEL
ncbi:solute carrier family 12 member 9 isoform X1 [Paroedura picta]|uniref:solute carrier family 12 member 9 isoform X1 n=1 Tax=Paroedura picta TaxID=143630 RepID=UPI004056D075